jgi:hypothetical protein
LGELVIQADQASVAQSLGGNPSRALAAPPHSLQKKLLDGLRYLLKETLKLNQPQASDGWLTQDALWLVSKTVSDRLRAHLLAQGIEGIPANNTALFDLLQDHGFLLATADGKAIWKATVIGDNGWSHMFTLLKLSPSLIWETGEERPASFAGTVAVVAEDASDEAPATALDSPVLAQPATGAPSIKDMEDSAPSVSDGVDQLLQLFDTPNDIPEEARPPEMIEVAPPVVANVAMAEPEHLNAPQEPSGEHFITWLRQRIISRVLIINDAKAPAR